MRTPQDNQPLRLPRSDNGGTRSWLGEWSRCDQRRLAAMRQTPCPKKDDSDGDEPARVHSLPVAASAADVTARRTHDDDARYAEVTRSWAIAVVIRMRVAMVIRSTDDELTSEVRIAKSERNTDAGLGRGDASGQRTQQSDENEDAFHDCLLRDAASLRKRRASTANPCK